MNCSFVCIFMGLFLVLWNNNSNSYRLGCRNLLLYHPLHFSYSIEPLCSVSITFCFLLLLLNCNLKLWHLKIVKGISRPLSNIHRNQIVGIVGYFLDSFLIHTQISVLQELPEKQCVHNYLVLQARLEEPATQSQIHPNCLLSTVTVQPQSFTVTYH